MRKSKFSESQIMGILAEGEAGLPVGEVCRKHGISSATYYQWKSKYAGMSVPELKRVQGARGRERPAQAAVCGPGAGERGDQGRAVAKVLTPAAKRAVIEVLVNEHRLSRTRACRIANLSRSAYDKSTVDWAQRDAPVVDALNEIVAKRTRWGFWKCLRRLRADGHGWNHKRVHRIYCRMRLNLKRRTKRRTFSRERQPLLAPGGLNKIWSVDFMHDTTYDGRTFRTFNVIDEGNREGLRIECGKSIPSARVVRVMQQLVEVYGRPDAIRLDNGPEFTAEKFIEWAETNGVKLLYIEPGRPNQNAFIERFNRSFREEVLDANLFDALADLQAIADEWLDDYNGYRPHESLGNVPPTQFMTRVFATEVSTFDLSA